MILLDTHVLVWWRAAPTRLTRAQSRRIERQLVTGVPLGISAVSLWELALLGEREQLKLPSSLETWLDSIENDRRLYVYPLSAQIAADAARLPRDFPRDPADRIITATARCETLELVTADERIRASGLVRVI